MPNATGSKVRKRKTGKKCFQVPERLLEEFLSFLELSWSRILADGSGHLTPNEREVLDLVEGWTLPEKGVPSGRGFQAGP
jgi:hypothetical protein